MARVLGCSFYSRELLPATAKMRMHVAWDRTQIKGGDGSSAAVHKLADCGVKRRLDAVVKSTRVLARQRLEGGARDQRDRLADRMSRGASPTLMTLMIAMVVEYINLKSEWRQRLGAGVGALSQPALWAPRARRSIDSSRKEPPSRRATEKGSRLVRGRVT